MNYEDVEKNIHRFLKKKLKNTGAKGYIIGISGGIDSAVTSKLAVDAVGAEKVHGRVMPGKTSKQENINDAVEHCEDLGLDFEKVNIEEVVSKFSETAPLDIDEVAEGNIRARSRMIYQYIEANERNLLVLGAGNKTEIMTGYFTKHGDGATDINPIADLYKTEVKKLAEHLGINSKFIEKEPTAGLWKDQTDESELGASYEKIDRILNKLYEENLGVEETSNATGIDESEVKRFKEIYEKSAHKREKAEYPSVR